MIVKNIIHLGLLLLMFSTWAQATASTLPETTWITTNEQNENVVHLYFFWSKKCPHCLEALPYIEILADGEGWLQVHSYQLVGEPENVRRFQIMARSVGGEAQSVPGFVFCNTMLTGFDIHITPQNLESSLSSCKRYVADHGSLAGFVAGRGDDITVSVPLLGQVGSAVDSLPFITLAIAGVDAFNPCAFFVLMFLMSLMLHTGSRRRMFLVGGVFVFFSGLLYFLFMAAWLNLFRMIGHLQVITVVAGLVALTVGAINMKDFVYFKKGISLTINESAKPRLFQRMRNLLQAQSLSTLIAATVGLALFANLYEFLCTAGFPMVYTRILTLNDLPYWQYYAYLVLYNVVYVVPLLVIVVLFAWSTGGRKLQEQEGRRLKLVSGVMMLALGTVLLIDPGLLQNLLAALTILIIAILVSMLVIYTEKWLSRKQDAV
jgi:hypothetical protein